MYDILPLDKPKQTTLSDIKLQNLMLRVCMSRLLGRLFLSSLSEEGP